MDFDGLIMDYLSSLTPLQKEIVTSPHKNICVIAGPGTGKTRVLISRLLYRLNNNNLNKKIIAITFTNKAAEEITERLKKTLGTNNVINSSLFIGTIHSFCYKKLERKFTILDEDQVYILFNEYCKKNQIKNIQSNYKLIRKIKELSQEEIDQNLIKLYIDFKNFMKENQLLEYDDLISEMIENFNNINEEYEEILVDEFQDLNISQYILLKKMINRSRGIFVIGDPNQSIYGFRGALTNIFLTLQEELKDVKVYNLNESFRNPPNILNLATKIIEKHSLYASIKSNIAFDGKIIYKTFESDIEEGRWIVKKIKELTGNQDLGLILSHGNKKIYEYNQIAILFRLHSISENVINILKNNNIPIKTIKDSIKTKDLLKYLQIVKFLIDNKNSEYFRKLAIEFDKKLNLNFTEIVNNFQTIDEVIETLLQKVTEKNDIVSKIILEKILSEKERLNEVFLRYTDEIDFFDFERVGVNLLTLHASKGLEFPVVFIIGLEEGILPLEDAEIIEEKRLFYVGLTRSSEILILTSCKNRETHKANLLPSQFIEKLELIPLMEEKNTRKKNLQRKLF